MRYGSPVPERFAINMKILLVLFSILNLQSLWAGVWTHSVVEGEGGGINANYFFYQTFKPEYGDGTLMSVQKVRAIYAQSWEAGIVVIDYFLEDGIRVVTMQAAKESLTDLIAGKDVDFKKTNEFKIEAETSVGYLTPKITKEMTKIQQERILNLVSILSMQRSPIKSEPQR